MTAVSHPLRRQILRIYVDHAPESVSAVDMAKATQQPVARVSYHLRTLAHCNLLRPLQPLRDGGAGGRSPRWALDTDSEWLALMLDLWARSDLPR